MKKFLGIAVVALTLSGCGIFVDQFAEDCKDRGGQIMEDTTSTTGINSKDGGLVTGTVTVRLCVYDGDVVDMEVN